MDTRPHRDEPTPRSVEQIRDDHYLHWAAMLMAGGYAWQLHGFLVGVAVIVSLIVAISLINGFLLRNGHDRLIRRNRWLWVVVAFVVIGLFGASIETVAR